MYIKKEVLRQDRYRSATATRRIFTTLHSWVAINSPYSTRLFGRRSIYLKPRFPVTASTAKLIFLIVFLFLLSYFTLSLRSSTAPQLQRPQSVTAFASRAFIIAAPIVWNSLSANTRSADSLTCFKRRLKSELFATAYAT